ncbi:MULTISPECIES: hypothetical protein [unclassified Candidatus Cardinium]|uniref:hypothetical protein n=1 Tax=unclassified Candidatus Cardinium TaxID=2641185 RepID=UPI001FB21242|nr:MULTISPECIES: hypothetical protein [unclassified Candidatus Cardinium]
MKTKNNQNVKPIKILANAPLYCALLVSTGCIFGEQKPIQDVMSVQGKNKENDHKTLDEGQDTTQDGQVNVAFTSDSPIESDKVESDAGSKQQPSGSSKAAIEKDSNKAVLSGANSGATSTESGENKQDQNQIIDDPNNKNEGNNIAPQGDDEVKNSAGSSQTDHNASSSLMLSIKSYWNLVQENTSVDKKIELELEDIEKKVEEIARLQEEIKEILKKGYNLPKKFEKSKKQLINNFMKYYQETVPKLLQKTWNDAALSESQKKANIKKEIEHAMQDALELANEYVETLRETIQKKKKK